MHWEGKIRTATTKEVGRKPDAVYHNSSHLNNQLETGLCKGKKHTIMGEKYIHMRNTTIFSIKMKI